LYILNEIYYSIKIFVTQKEKKTDCSPVKIKVTQCYLNQQKLKASTRNKTMIYASMHFTIEKNNNMIIIIERI